MMTLKEMLLERQIDQAERLGCLMAMVDESTATKILEFNKKLIKEKDLYHKINEKGEDEFGREKECHVTIRYGFTKDLNELDIRQLLKGHKEFLVELNDLDIFDTNPEFDVVKFNVNSSTLNQLNELSGIYPNKSDYPDYKPHITLAYVKKGTFPHKKKIKLEIPIKSVCYSPISGGKSHFQLEESNVYNDIDAKISKLEQEWDKLDATGTNSVRQHEIEKELVQLRFEKEMYSDIDIQGGTEKSVSPDRIPVDPSKAKELFKQMRQATNEVIVRLTKEDAQEILHKIGILNDSPDLQSDYGISQEQSNLLLNTIPHNGGNWNIPDWAIPAVKGEIEDHITVLRDIAQDAYNGGQTGQSLRINKQAKRLEILFGNL